MKGKKLQSKSTGYSLVELIVSVGLFAIVMTLLTTSLFTIISASREARANQLAFDNLRFALDSMTRDIRTGRNWTNFNPGENICDESGLFNFTSSEGDSVEYKCINGELRKGGNALTAPEIEITHLSFVKQKEESGVKQQPRITILVRGGVEQNGGTQAPFNLQTTVSQRALSQSN